MIPRTRHPRQEPQQHTLARTFRHNEHISAYFDQRSLTQFDMDLLFDEDLLRAISFILDVGENYLGIYRSSVYALATEYATLMRMLYAAVTIFLQGEIELYNLDISGSIRDFTASMHHKLQLIGQGRRYVMNAVEGAEWALHEVRTEYFSRVHGFCVFENHETPGALYCTKCFSSNIANHLMNIKQVLQEHTSWLHPHVLSPATLRSHVSSVLENPYLTDSMRSLRRINLRRFQAKWSQMGFNSMFGGPISEWESSQVYTRFRKLRDLSEIYLRTNQILPSFQSYRHRVHESTAFTTCFVAEYSDEYGYDSDSDPESEIETSHEINAIGVKFLSTWRPSGNREQAEFGRANTAGRRNYAVASSQNQLTHRTQDQASSSWIAARQPNQQNNPNRTREAMMSSVVNWAFGSPGQFFRRRT